MGDFEKQNDPYLWNHVWYTFSVSTTVGYGDVHASTQAGRLVSVVVSVVSTLMIALLTSSFMVKLSYSDAEVAASLMLDRARAESTLMSRAAKFVSAWFRSCSCHSSPVSLLMPQVHASASRQGPEAA